MKKTAFITGSTSGIGKKIGIDLLNLGYFVNFNGSSSNSCKKLHNQLTNDYYNYHIIEADMSLQCENIKERLEFPIDVLILCAGVTDRTPFGEISYENWDKVFNTNLKEPFFLVQSIKDLINLNGSIIFISSVVGIVPNSRSISYGVSKSSIIMLVKYLAKEFAKKQITVNAIAPGFINTPWHDNKTKNQIVQITNKIPLNRFGNTKEISTTAQFIINNRYITGQTIIIDGGYTL